MLKRGGCIRVLGLMKVISQRSVTSDNTVETGRNWGTVVGVDSRLVCLLSVMILPTAILRAASRRSLCYLAAISLHTHRMRGAEPKLIGTTDIQNDIEYVS